MSWVSAGKFPQISAMKILLLPVTGSIAFHGHHFMHLNDIIWFQRVLKYFRLTHFCAVHFIFVVDMNDTDSISDAQVVGRLLFSGLMNLLH